jgi:hypothetical protein
MMSLPKLDWDRNASPSPSTPSPKTPTPVSWANAAGGSPVPTPLLRSNTPPPLFKLLQQAQEVQSESEKKNRQRSEKLDLVRPPSSSPTVTPRTSTFDLLKDVKNYHQGHQGKDEDRTAKNWRKGTNNAVKGGASAVFHRVVHPLLTRPKQVSPLSTIVATWTITDLQHINVPKIILTTPNGSVQNVDPSTSWLLHPPYIRKGGSSCLIWHDGIDEWSLYPDELKHRPRESVRFLDVPAPAPSRLSIAIEVAPDFDIFMSMEVLDRDHTWRVLMASNLVDLKITYKRDDTTKLVQSGGD